MDCFTRVSGVWDYPLYWYYKYGEGPKLGVQVAWPGHSF